MKQHLFLLRELVKRDFQSRYVGSLLGALWAFLVPLWQLLLFSFVFATVMKISLVGERTDNFAIFMFCGMLPWMAINEGITRSATAISDNAPLVKKMSFPSEILVVAVVLSGLIHEAIAAVVFLVILAFTGDLASWGVLHLLWLLPLQVGLTVGLGLFLCCVQTLFRDTVQFLNMALMGWFFFTPIVYSISLVPERMRTALEWNPLAVLVTGYRQALLAGDESHLRLYPVLGTVVFVLVVLVLGIKTFRRFEPVFADEI
jgi:ABC-type polysaccharide/polyol phosphate export permease